MKGTNQTKETDKTRANKKQKKATKLKRRNVSATFTAFVIPKCLMNSIG